MTNKIILNNEIFSEYLPIVRYSEACQIHFPFKRKRVIFTYRHGLKLK